MKRTYKSYSIDVTQAGQTITGKFTLDKTVQRVVGLAMTATRPDLLLYRGSQRISIGGDEIIPEGHESKMLYPGVNTSPDRKYLSVDVAPGNGQLELRYTDAAAGNTVFAPYTVSVQLALDVTVK